MSAVRSWRAIGPALLIAALFMPCRASAQFGNSGESMSPTIQQLLSYLSIGGYFFTGSARNSLGTPKFYTDSLIYGRPKHIGAFLLSGGVELVNAGDYLLPFETGNLFGLYGASFRITTKPGIGRLRPYITGGLFLGRVRSVDEDFDRTGFAPSVSFGVSWKFIRYLTLAASYRVSEHIYGVNTDGFGLTLKLF